MSSRFAGPAYALSGFLIWGLSPLYWKYLRHVPALETLMNRLLWSAPLMAWFVWRRGGWTFLQPALKPKTLAVLFLTTALIGVNWWLYIWAINAGRVLETSLGYFIAPLVNVALGVIFLNECLKPLQAAALAVAAAAVLYLAVSHGSFPWVALALASTFGAYAFLRKTSPVDAVTGLAVEVWLLVPPALAWLVYRGANPAAHGTATFSLLALSSIVTALPLLLYTEGARRMSLKNLGFLQYVSPTCQFLVGVFVFAEPLDPAKLKAFAAIWVALALYCVDIARRMNRQTGLIQINSCP